MTNRVAKKLVKKYGATWFMMEIATMKVSADTLKYISFQGFRVPPKWDNPKVRRYLNRYYGFLRPMGEAVRVCMVNPAEIEKRGILEYLHESIVRYEEQTARRVRAIRLGERWRHELRGAIGERYPYMQPIGGPDEFRGIPILAARGPEEFILEGER